MIRKVLNEIKKILKDNYKGFLVFVCLFIVLTVPLPYYINTPGGLINVNDRINIAGSNKLSGSLNLTYVSELKATIPTLLIAYFNDDWDILKKEDLINENENMGEAAFRSHLFLEEANNDAIKYVYNKANKEVKIKNSQVYITYIDKTAKTDLKIQDEIISINGIDIKTKKDAYNVLKTKKLNDELYIKVRYKDEIYFRTATVSKFDDLIGIGIVLTEKQDLELNPNLKLNFSKSESGPSGGFMMSLAIYNYLVEDLTKNRTIAGTGTIDINGNVGEIGGIEYKIKGAVKKDVDVFLVPSGDNYKDAIKLKEKNNYNIEIIEIKTFDDAINYLKK